MLARERAREKEMEKGGAGSGKGKRGKGGGDLVGKKESQSVPTKKLGGVKGCCEGAGKKWEEVVKESHRGVKKSLEIGKKIGDHWGGPPKKGTNKANKWWGNPRVLGSQQTRPPTRGVGNLESDKARGNGRCEKTEIRVFSGD